MFSRGTRTLVKFYDAVIKRAQSHEPAPISDLEARRIDVDNESRDLLALPPVDHLRRCHRHDHEHTSLDQVGAPKFFTVENEGRAVLGGVGAQTHVRRIRASVPFGQRECGNFLSRNPWQIFFLLLVSSKEQQRLRNADRLMGRDQRGQIFIPAPKQAWPPVRN